MDWKEKQRLEQGGALRPMGAGFGVRVTLQLAEAIPMSSHSQLVRDVRDRFEAIEAKVSQRGACIDLDSISELSQSAEAAIPLDDYDHLRALLEREFELNVVPIVQEQLVDVH